MHTQWQVIDFKLDSTLPAPGQDIYLSISEGEGSPFTDPRRMAADPGLLQELQRICPNWLLAWQPLPAPPKPPVQFSGQGGKLNNV